jgi:hypothetical protein
MTGQAQNDTAPRCCIADKLDPQYLNLMSPALHEKVASLSALESALFQTKYQNYIPQKKPNWLVVWNMFYFPQ